MIRARGLFLFSGAFCMGFVAPLFAQSDHSEYFDSRPQSELRRFLNPNNDLDVERRASVLARYLDENVIDLGRLREDILRDLPEMQERHVGDQQAFEDRLEAFLAAMDAVVEEREKRRKDSLRSTLIGVTAAGLAVGAAIGLLLPLKGRAELEASAWRLKGRRAIWTGGAGGLCAMALSLVVITQIETPPSPRFTGSYTPPAALMDDQESEGP